MELDVREEGVALDARRREPLHPPRVRRELAPEAALGARAAELLGEVGEPRAADEQPAVVPQPPQPAVGAALAERQLLDGARLAQRCSRSSKTSCRATRTSYAALEPVIGAPMTARAQLASVL